MAHKPDHWISDENEGNLWNTRNPPTSPTYTPSDVATGEAEYSGHTHGTRNPNPNRNVPPEVPERHPTKTPEQLKAEAQARIASRMPPKRPIDVFGAHAKITQQPNRTIGANYFLDIDAHGFSLNTKRLETDYKLTPVGDPVNPPQKYLDSKGDFNPKYSRTSKAEPVYRTPISPTQKQLNKTIQEKGIPTDLFLDSKGDFVPIFNEFRKSSTITNTVSSANSRLWTLHENGITTREGKISLRTTNEGYTNYMPAVKLDDYYARLIKDTGKLGLRNDGVDNNLFGNNSQPIVIRQIGRRWGVNKFKIPLDVPNYVQKAVDAVADATEAIYGRHPAVYVDRYQADVTRLLPFTIGNYLAKQIVFQRRNPFKYSTSAQYSIHSLMSDSDFKFELGNLAVNNDTTRFLNPRGYNPLSIFSTPGVVMIRRNTRFVDPDAIWAVTKKIAAVGIAAVISVGAVKAALPIAGKVIQSILPIGGAIAGMLHKLTTPEFQAGQSMSILQFKTQGRLKEIWKGSFSKFSIKGIKESIAIKGLPPDHYLVKGYKAIGETLESGVTWAQEAGDWARQKAKNFNEHVGKLGKGALKDINITAFNNVGVDYVNLIPYASTQYEGQEYDTLDTIPFKFQDIRHDTPIVFRAILSGITDTFTPEYSPERYVGRPDNVYVYQGTDREIAFTFDVYPKSDVELITLWEKLNYLAGLTYPHMSEPGPDGGRGMVSPYTRLTIGQMYTEAPGFINSLTYTVMDEGTWETTFAKLPKYIQVQVAFTYW